MTCSVKSKYPRTYSLHGVHFRIGGSPLYHLDRRHAEAPNICFRIVPVSSDRRLLQAGACSHTAAVNLQETGRHRKPMVLNIVVRFRGHSPSPARPVLYTMVRLPGGSEKNSSAHTHTVS